MKTDSIQNVRPSLSACELARVPSIVARLAAAGLVKYPSRSLSDDEIVAIQQKKIRADMKARGWRKKGKR